MILCFVFSGGSPPHSREKQRFRDGTGIEHRSNPAYAGKTEVQLQSRFSFQDHPRIRGKDRIYLSVSLRVVGSPSHTRERLHSIFKTVDSIRITPAYAGKTFFSAVKLEFNQDHPRIRGKDTKLNKFLPAASGSPPHTRERLHSDTYNTRYSRITPAYAGKTRFILLIHAFSQDHPRIRGKDVVLFSIISLITGSPPHTRERPGYLLSLLNLFGITPAYAGKTHYQCLQLLLHQDHPRIRGKDLNIPENLNDELGSPPHTRERLLFHRFSSPRHGITPAYAGKTLHHLHIQA